MPVLSSNCLPLLSSVDIEYSKLVLSRGDHTFGGEGAFSTQFISPAFRSLRLFKFVSMDIISSKRATIVTLSQHTSMTERKIAATTGVGKSIVSRIKNIQKEFGTVSLKRTGNCGRKCKTEALDRQISFKK